MPSQEPDTSDHHHTGLAALEPAVTVAHMEGMRRALVLIGLVLLPGGASAQRIVRLADLPPADTVRNGVYFELFGPGLLYSLNYERHVRSRTAVQVGFTRWSAQFLGPKHIVRAGLASVSHHFALPRPFPDDAHIELGGGFVGGKHALEERVPSDTTLSAVLIRKTTSSPWIALTGLVGLRFQPAKGGWTYRIGLVPTYVLRDLPQYGRPLISPPGLSFGYTW